MPDSRHFFVFALLRNAVRQRRSERHNSSPHKPQTLERNVVLGGQALSFRFRSMTKHDWQGKHYQPLWGAFVSAKRHFDPAEILTPGQGIF